MFTGRWLATADSLVALERLVEEVRNGILTGKFAPGYTFSISHLDRLCDRHGEIVVDAALSRLINEGLMIREGNRPQVTPLDSGMVRGAYRARHLLEPELAVAAVATLDRSNLDELEQLTQDLIYSAGSPRRPTLAAAQASRRLVLTHPQTWEARTLSATWKCLAPYLHRSLAPRSNPMVMTTAHDLGLNLILAYRRGRKSEIRHAMHDALAEYERIDSLVFGY